jgi:bifunctional non-homologous end joining protein LigD
MKTLEMEAMPFLNAVALQNAVLCAECEVVSDSPHDTCLEEERHGEFQITTRMQRTGPGALRIRCIHFPTRECRRLSRGTRCRTATPADFTVLTVPKRFAKMGDPHAGMDAAPGSLEKLLELAEKDKADGLGDAPWPPHFRESRAAGQGW